MNTPKAIGVVFLLLLAGSIARVVSVRDQAVNSPAEAPIAAPVSTQSLADQRKEYAADVIRARGAALTLLIALVRSLICTKNLPISAVSKNT